jgi:hypothetical protein
VAAAEVLALLEAAPPLRFLEVATPLAFAEPPESTGPLRLPEAPGVAVSPTSIPPAGVAAGPVSPPRGRSPLTRCPPRFAAVSPTRSLEIAV